MSKSSDVPFDFSRPTYSSATRRTFMRGLGTTMMLPLAARLSGQSLQPVATYKNPLNIEIGDPYVLKAPDGQYYIYGTGGGGGMYGGGSDPKVAFPTFTSKNLVEWTSVGYTYARNPDDSWCIGAFWAPEVYHVKGKYYMFYSAQWRTNPTNEKENFRIGVAVADKPTGPFRDIRNEPLFDPGYPAIDADVLFDDDGRMYLYYSRCCYKHPVESELATMAKEKGWYKEIEESWVYGVELKPDFSGIVGEPVVVLRPPEKMEAGTEWENLSVTTHEAGRRWTEGPCSFKKYGKYFVMYSANSVIGQNYSLGYATGEHPLGPFVKAANNPVLRKNTDRGGEVSCTAHNCVAMSPDESEMFCLFGGRTTKTKGFSRILFLTRMEVQKDGTVVVYPPDVVTPQPLPSGASLG